jgi:hypothetical protein
MNQIKLFNEFIHNLLSLFESEKGSRTMIVYAHNLSEFDGVFIMKYLMSFGEVKPLLHNGKLISIRLRVNIKGHKNKTIIFKDSFLMLPHSLRELCYSLKVVASKGYFPFLLNDLNYKGEFPEYKYFTSISLNEYLTIKNQFNNKIWSFKKEAVKYCELDCVSLHQVISKFSELVFNNFKTDPIKVLTLPSLAMKIWKTFYMPKDSVYQLHELPEYNIRQSYSGGAVDVYIPHNKNNETLFYYDVNSLYPSVMLNNLMPVGKPVPFIGNIRNIDPEAFGFFYCKITSPEYLEHPILQRSIKTSEGLRTIAGLGTWSGWIFSAEMDNAMKYGYTFEIIKGYEFNKADIFSKYINKMYSLRLQYPKGDALNLIAKLLLNSLYGKFGMKSETTKVEILDNNNKEELNNFLDKFDTNIVDIIYLENYTILIYNTNRFVPSDINNLFADDVTQALDINIAVASAITAYARIKMSSLKNNPNYNLYYSDTDSAVVDRPLPSELVGKEIGLFKLEHTISKAVFLAPKVYGLVDTEGNEIIKAKGLTKDTIKSIKVSDLELLLRKDATRVFTQEKGYKSLFKSDISVLNTVYTLQATSNKRQNIYINGIFDSTKPLNYKKVS